MQIITEDQARAALITYMHKTGTSQHAIAKRLGISGTYMSDMVHGKRALSAELAAFIGYTRQVVFIKADPDDMIGLLADLQKEPPHV